jgi:hypothetical protein
MLIILEKHKITQDIKQKLLNKGLKLIGMSDKEIIFYKLKPRFLHWAFFIFGSYFKTANAHNEKP